MWSVVQLFFPPLDFKLNLLRWNAPHAGPRETTCVPEGVIQIIAWSGKIELLKTLLQWKHGAQRPFPEWRFWSNAIYRLSIVFFHLYCCGISHPSEKCNIPFNVPYVVCDVSPFVNKTNKTCFAVSSANFYLSTKSWHWNIIFSGSFGVPRHHWSIYTNHILYKADSLFLKALYKIAFVKFCNC
jgi:hypothetical protein